MIYSDHLHDLSPVCQSIYKLHCFAHDVLGLQNIMVFHRWPDPVLSWDQLLSYCFVMPGTQERNAVGLEFCPKSRYHEVNR